VLPDPNQFYSLLGDDWIAACPFQIQKGGAITLARAVGGQPSRSFPFADPAPIGHVREVALSPDRRRLAAILHREEPSLRGSSLVVVWDVSRGAEIGRYHVNGQLAHLNFGSDSARLTARCSPAMYLFSVGDVRRGFLRWQPADWQDEGRLLLAGKAEALKALEPDVEHPLSRIDVETGYPEFFSPDGAVSLSVAEEGFRLIDRGSGRERRIAARTSGGPFVFARDGRHAAWITSSSHQRIDVRAGCVTEHALPSDGAVPDPNCNIHHLERSMDYRTGMAFDRQGRCLAFCYRYPRDDGEASVRDLAGGPPLLKLSAHWTDGALSPDGSSLLVWSNEGKEEQDFESWDVARREKRAAWRGQLVHLARPALSPDGRLAVAVRGRWGGRFEGGEADVWELATGRRVARLAGWFDPRSAGVFSPDGRLLALAYADGSGVGVWDPEQGRELFRWRRQADEEPGAEARGRRTMQLQFTDGGKALLVQAGPWLERLDLERLRRRLAEMGLDWE
jgi:hypothetical protein